MSLRSAALLIGSILVASTTSAGEVRLTNGDRLAGELVSISENDILWNSATVGKIKISKDNIRAITSSAPLKLRGRDEPCHWQELRGTQVIFSCANGDLDFEPLYSLKQVVPYVITVNEFYTYNGNVAVSGSKFGGNFNQQDWLVDTRFEVRYSDVRHTFEIDYKARSFDESPLDETYDGSYFFDWYFKTRGYWQNEVSVLKDETRNIKERYAYGSGLGYEFWRTPISLLAIELGGRYERTAFEVIPPYNPNIEYRVETGLWRWGLNFNYKLPLEITFRHQSQYFQPIDAHQEWRVESETSMAIPLGFGISANVTYEYDYLHAPPENSVNADSVLRFGLDYSW